MYKLFTAGIISLFLAHSAGAQSAVFDGERLISMCQQEACVRGVKATVGQVLLERLLPGDFNSQLGIIAGLLFAATDGAEEPLLGQLAAGLRALAQYSTDPAQQASFIQVAGEIVSGSASLFDLDAPFAVSPS
ncbi:MAG: hypothetical protein V3V25_08165 [Paracoccaceae bacterium]